MKKLFFYLSLSLCLPLAASAQLIDATCLAPQARTVGGALELYLPCGFSSYQWHRNGEPIPGANQATLRPQAKGKYTATVACFSEPVQVAQNRSGQKPNAAVLMYPSPARSRLFIELRGESPEYANLRITDLMGRNVAQAAFTPIDPQNPVLEFDLAGLPQGKYFVTLLTPSQKITQPLVIE